MPIVTAGRAAANLGARGAYCGAEPLDEAVAEPGGNGEDAPESLFRQIGFHDRPGVAEQACSTYHGGATKRDPINGKFLKAGNKAWGNRRANPNLSGTATT